MPTYAMCPTDGCETIIPDYGTSSNLKCPRCGKVIRSISIYSDEYELELSRTQYRSSAPAQYQYPTQPQQSQHSAPYHVGMLVKLAFRMLSIMAMLIFFAIVTTNIGLMFYSATIIVPGILENTISSPIFIAIPEIIVITTVSGYSMLAWYFIVISCIAASFVVIYKAHIADFSKKMFVSLGKLSKPKDNPIIDISTVFFATFFFSVAFSALSLLLVDAGALANPPATPPFGEMDTWYLLYSFSVASFWEEIIMRVLFIGVPIAILALIRGARANALRVLIGGKSGGLDLSAFPVFLIFVSSAIFGIAHVYNWDMMKILPAFVTGLGLGYLYVKHGLPAAIALHFAFDYMSAITMLFEIPAGVAATIAMILFLWTGVGFVYFVKYGLGLVKLLASFFGTMPAKLPNTTETKQNAQSLKPLESETKDRRESGEQTTNANNVVPSKNAFEEVKPDELDKNDKSRR